METQEVSIKGGRVTQLGTIQHLAERGWHPDEATRSPR